MINNIVRLLFVEDSADDVELANRALWGDGLRFVWQQVATELDLLCALRDFRPDVVICDSMLPGFSGQAALAVIRCLSPATPCISLSGVIGEDAAIRSLGEGYVDYVLKSNRLRLGPSVRRALAEARERARALEVEAELHRLAHYDTLTGLPNLARMDALVRRCVEAARTTGRVGAVVTVNLDAFRLVEEGFGRTIGDDVLRSVSDTVIAAVKDPAAIARVGGDEFVIILDDLAQPVDATLPAQKILDAIAVPRSVGSQELRITASAGVAVFPDDGDEFETLLQKSSAATHDIKARTRGQLQFYSGDVTRRAQRRLHLESGLRKAIQNGELTIHYQPQFEIRSGRVCGVEALSRWTPPGGEAVAPSVFIPLAEQTGLIATLGSWVLQKACATVKSWRDSCEQTPTLCINVSTQQICHEFSAELARVMTLTHFPAECLELEITESVLMRSADLALACLAELKRMGVRIAVDDFGTGYSGLNYLAQLPVDRLKLDKSLVHNMTTVGRDAAIVRSAISLGRELGFTVLAEGVETEAQLELLTELGCQQVQGYLTGRPACAAEARALLKKNWGQRHLGRTGPIHTNAQSEAHHAV